MRAARRGHARRGAARSPPRPPRPRPRRISEPVATRRPTNPNVPPISRSPGKKESSVFASTSAEAITAEAAVVLAAGDHHDHHVRAGVYKHYAVTAHVACRRISCSADVPRCRLAVRRAAVGLVEVVQQRRRRQSPAAAGVAAASRVANASRRVGRVLLGSGGGGEETRQRADEKGAVVAGRRRRRKETTAAVAAAAARQGRRTEFRRARGRRHVVRGTRGGGAAGAGAGAAGEVCSSGECISVVRAGVLPGTVGARPYRARCALDGRCATAFAAADDDDAGYRRPHATAAFECIARLVVINRTTSTTRRRRQPSRQRSAGGIHVVGIRRRPRAAWPSVRRERDEWRHHAPRPWRH